MKNYFTIFVSLLSFLPAIQAQSLGTAVRIVPVPEGPYFSVDGQNFSQATSAIWPNGSKHVLSAEMEQNGLQLKTRIAFNSWETAAGKLPGNTVTITADPAITEYRVKFSVQYALSLIFYDCQASVCSSPGIIYNGTTPLNRDQDIYVSPGSTVTLLAVPNPGYVFAGWAPGPGQVIAGPLNTVTLNSPVSVRPVFQVARPINIVTAPEGLQVLADRALVTTPVTLDWGWNSTHSVGPVSPQQDRLGNWWVFQSWSDGGAPTHAYQVAQVSRPDTITANYVAGAPIAFTTSPANLKLKIDGRDNWPSYNFLWGVGETHRFEAPATQTDAQGRVWAFSGWSNGGGAAQDFSVTPELATGGVRLVATFTPVGHLTIDSSLLAVSVQVDGTTCVTPCDIQRPVGTSIRVSVPASIPQGDGVRADFVGFPGGSNEWVGTLTGDPVNLKANYRIMNRLAAAATPPEGASWNLQPASADGYYEPQTTVVVNVTALPGYRFGSWSGDLSGSKPVGVVSMNLPRSITARLDRSPYIAPAGVANAAGTTPGGAVAPGSVVAIFGASLASAVAIGPTNPLAQTLGGMTVRLGDRLLPIFFVSPTQINVQLPDDIGLGDQSLTVTAQGQADVQGAFKTARNAPGLFQQVIDEKSFAVALHEDGSAVTASAPARRGELLTLFGTGFGPTDRPRLAGFAVPAEPVYRIVDAAVVTLADAPVTVENAFAVAGRVGIDAVQFRLAEGAPSAVNATLRVSFNGQDSNPVLLPVE